MPKFRTAVPLAFVVLLAGCGAGKDGAAPARKVKRSDLGRMVVPKRDLGALTRGLKLDRDWSGRIDNKKATEDTIDPRDTGRTLTRAGRVQGYGVTYASWRHPSALGVVAVSQGVELFRTEKAASANRPGRGRQDQWGIRVEGRARGGSGASRRQVTSAR